MGGYAFAMGPCLFCGVPFTFNPLRVPSLKVKGVKEPICKSCHAAANRYRVENGIEPFPEPHPDAYEACKEEDII